MDAPFYIHALDPILLPIAGPFAIRWYGLAYVAGFIFTYLLLSRWSQAGWYRVRGEALQSLILYCVVGVMLGGRIGYLAFYDFPAWRAEPLLFFQVWRGGMSSHGGLLGLTLAIFWFSRQHRIPFLHLTDGLVCAGTQGIALGRLANFVNGELWGRVTTARWAVLFPQEAGLTTTEFGFREATIRLYEAGVISPRHPSQLYAAVAEGILVGTLLLVVRRTAWAQSNGRLSALFLCAYAVARISVEFFREPEITYFGWLTQGQLLSLLMFVPAAFVFRAASRTAGSR